MHFALEGLVEEAVARVVLDVLPAGVAMSAKSCSQGKRGSLRLEQLAAGSSSSRIRDDTSQQPVVMATVPYVVHLSRRQRRSLFCLPESVQL